MNRNNNDITEDGYIIIGIQLYYYIWLYHYRYIIISYKYIILQ